MESSVPTEEMLETLTKRGWCFGNVEEVKAVIMINSALHDEGCTVDSVESELANMDLRSIGAKSLPDPSLLRKSSYLHGPKVLQATPFLSYLSLLILLFTLFGCRENCGEGKKKIGNFNFLVLFCFKILNSLVLFCFGF